MTKWTKKDDEATANGSHDIIAMIYALLVIKIFASCMPVNKSAFSSRIQAFPVTLIVAEISAHIERRRQNACYFLQIFDAPYTTLWAKTRSF